MEGLMLFAILWLYARKPRATGQVSGLFLIGYGAFRFLAEYFREPDAFLGYLALGLSMGQWLCVPMMVAGAALWWWSGQRDQHPATRT
jgi:phosphatidylglycerol:prolipoprotein diacylglycerol transferase